MATTPLRPCLGRRDDGRICGEPSPGPYCADHQPVYGYDHEWRTRTRPAVLARDNWSCRLNRPGCTARATTVHRLPEYGTVHDGNLDAYVSACAHCHGVDDAPRSKQPNRRLQSSTQAKGDPR